MSADKLSDIEYLKNPMQWPRLVCPIVHRKRIRNNEKPNCAVVLGDGLDEHDNMLLLVVYENIYNLTDAEAYKQASKEYLTPEALIEQGWEVD